MFTTKRLLFFAILGLAGFAALCLTRAGAAPAPEKGPLNGELKVDGKYGFMLNQTAERGYYGKVLAIDGSWVKMESYALTPTGKEDPKYLEEKQETLWLNLAQVTAVLDRPPASVVQGLPQPAEAGRGPGVPAGRGGRGGPGGGGGAGGRPGGPGEPGGDRRQER
jgi:hypothetical protein